MTYGSLFSGAGLGDFGFELARFECKWQIENDKYCRKILDLRWPEVKKYGNIKKVKPEELEQVDLVTGGFPCQPFSVAGKRVGEDDDRNLWPQMFRIIKDLKPRWVVAENVPGIIPLYLDTVLSDLENEGYECWPFVFSSHSLGAWHKRERLWIMGYAKCNGHKNGHTETRRKIGASKQGRLCEPTGTSKTMADTFATESGLQRCRRKHKLSTNQEKMQTCWGSWWATEPRVGRVVNGCANRVDRLKALGNGQTPCSTFLIGEIIKEIDGSK